MNRHVLFGVVASFLLLSAPVRAGAGSGNAAAGFEKLKSIAGVWETKDHEGKPVTVTYQVVSGGSAVMETIQHDTGADMVTVYHLDGDRLMMTHYCALGNQPRMKAGRIPDGEVKEIRFSFTGATNMKKNDPHMHGMVISFVTEQHVHAVWSLYEKGRLKYDVAFELAPKP